MKPLNALGYVALGVLILLWVWFVVTVHLAIVIDGGTGKDNWNDIAFFWGLFNSLLSFGLGVGIGNGVFTEKNDGK